PSDRQAAGQELLALLGALPALVLGAAEELGELLVARPLSVVDVALQPEGVAEARLREPEDVVVDVHGAGDATGLGRAHRSPPCRLPAVGSRLPRPVAGDTRDRRHGPWDQRPCALGPPSLPTPRPPSVRWHPASRHPLDGWS